MKNGFHCSFAKYLFYELPEKSPHVSFFVIYGYICENVYIGCIFNLRNLKGNGNAATEGVKMWSH